MKIIIYLMLSYILIILFRNWYVENVIKEKMKPLHKRLIYMLPFITKYLDEEGIRYVMYSGNLLGLYRHNNSFIPWDDDIDLVILKEDETFDKRLKNVDTKLRLYDMKLSDTPFGYAVDNIDHSVKGNKAYIDLFIFSNKDGIWKGNDWAVSHFKNEEFTDEMLFPIKKGIFEGVEVNIPNDSIGWLKQSYGKNCLTQARYTHIHHGNYFEKWFITITSPIPLFF
jgi:phosphorylcholine metabolism protein LicD